MGLPGTLLRRYYGLLAQRFCYIKREYQEVYEDCFRRQYNLIHRLETNKLRNVAKFFAHLLATDAISWGALTNITLTEDATTSSARIFIKILFQVPARGGRRGAALRCAVLFILAAAGVMAMPQAFQPG